MSQPTQALEHASVKQYCKAVKVPVVGANFVRLAEQAVKENRSHIGYLEALLAMESEERDRRAIAQRLRDAKLPRLKTLEEFDFGQDPRTGRRRLYRAGRAGGIPGRVRHGQDTSGHGSVRGRVPAEAARTVHDRREPGERTG